MKKFWINLFAIAALVLPLSVSAQDFAFSQYHYTPVLTNPAMLGIQEGINLSANYRNQQFRSGMSLSTPMFNVTYPLFNGGDEQSATIGLSVINDNNANFLVTSGVVLAGAYNVRLSNSMITFGLQGAFFQRRIDVTDLSTAAQFDQGIFNPSLPNGEMTNTVTGGFPTFGGGAMWSKPGEGMRPKFFLCGSALNINQPNKDYFSNDVDNQVPLRLQFTGGYQFMLSEQLAIMPNGRYINVAGNDLFNAGSWLTYFLRNETSTTEVSLGLWYNTNEFGTFSLEFQNDGILAAVSYDLPFGDSAATFQNNGVLELTFGLKIDRKGKKKATSADE